MKALWSYPIKPYKVNQAWGAYDDVYKQFGFSRHNGIDINLFNGQPIFTPFDGTCVRTGNQPNGGGIFLGIMSDPMEFSDGTYRVLADFLHCKELLITEGTKVKTGDKIALGDNTGFSTGPHCHTQWRRVSYWNEWVGDKLAWTNPDKNEANNSFDPTPYFTGFYACDINQVHDLQAQITEATEKTNWLVNIFKKLWKS